MSLSIVSDMEEFNLFEDLLPLGSSLDGLSGSLGEVDEFDYPGNVFPVDRRDQKLSSIQESCDGLDFLSIASAEDAFKDGWMENIDLSQLNDFLNGTDIPEIPSHDQLVSSTPEKLFVNELKQNASLNILHGLLTQPLEQEKTPVSSEARLSPELEQIDLLESMFDEGSVEVPNNLIEVESSLISSRDELDTSIVNNISVSSDSYVNSVNDISENSSREISLDSSDSEYLINSPLSVEDIDSILSGSEPGSPAKDMDPDYDPDYSEQQKTPRSSKAKSKSKPRAQPYELVSTEGLSKKERKRIQNRNAAIRYRNKKRDESTKVRSEEDILLDKNTSLKGQVEQLQREIEYMKNLMTDVCKAKGLNIKFVEK